MNRLFYYPGGAPVTAAVTSRSVPTRFNSGRW
jgi:hypothetical protein